MTYFFFLIPPPTILQFFFLSFVLNRKNSDLKNNFARQIIGIDFVVIVS